MFAMGSARRSPGAGGARVWAPLEAEPGPQEDGKPCPLEDGPGPSGTFQNGRWDGHPLPAGGPADTHGGAARNVMGE